MTQSDLNLQDLPAQFDHRRANRHYQTWEDKGYFHAEAVSEKPPYTIVIPPPNVTGALHLGHALNNTLQDILIRMKRMQGFNTLWMPGTDHAGIATQAVVERRLLEEEKLTRHDLGREGLVARIWQWKDQYEKRIISQLKRLGCSCDWARTQFTFNEHNSRAVRETFFHLFKDGKIYRGKRLVNWDTFLQTAVSDDEVFHETVKGSFWHFRYPVIDPKPGEPEFVTIATTRPETMLGDTAVAVHPDPTKALDRVEKELGEKLAEAATKDRAPIEAQIKNVRTRRQTMLRHLIQLRDMALRGVNMKLPLTDRDIPLIADEWAKPELGSGCVKITPSHDENDYAVGQRHPEIGAINIMNPDGTLNDSVAPKYRGLTMKKARDAVVADMETAGFYNPETDREDREIEIAHSDRSKTPIEPYVADQWFVKMDELAQSAMDAVTDGRVNIVPERYAKSYLDWLGEKRDWPVGRQLWWGHRIAVWSAELRQKQDDKAAQPTDASRIVAGKELAQAVEEFAAACEIPGELVANHPDPKSRLAYICARTLRAEQAIESHRLRMHWDNVKDPGRLPILLATDPRFEPEFRLAQAAAIGEQSPEVLDTWFSSALWPHSTLGWPDQTADLAEFYPTSALVTSRDIISLWVARMVLMGLYNLQRDGRSPAEAIPFHEVYITPKILDGYGETMSKSKGNGVDPIDVIEKFGADALRYGIAYLTTDTQDVKMPVEFECPYCQHLMAQTRKNRTLPRVECEKCKKPFGTQWAEKDEDKALPRAGVSNERFELGRRFANKLWNASRFSLMNLDGYTAGAVTDVELMLEDRWLLSRLATVTRDVTDALEHYRFSDAARMLYEFAWNDFCDYYVEITKARFKEPKQRAAAQRLLAHVLDTLLRLLHPIIPFLTEEVWQLLNQVALNRGLTTADIAKPSAESICIAAWPVADASRIDATIEEQFADFQAVLGAVREIRMGQNIPPRTSIEFRVRCKPATAKLLEPMRPYFTQIADATCRALGPDVTPPERAVSKSLGEIDVQVDVSAFFDVDAERARLAKEITQLRGHAESNEKKLANEGFVSRAPAEVVQQHRDKLAEVRGQIASAEAALAKLR